MSLKIDFLNNSESINEILNSINNSNKNILIKAFLWRDDEVGNQIAKALLNAANKGVKILILKDRIGAFFEFCEGNNKSLFHNKNEIKTVYMQAKILNKFYSKKSNFKNYKINNLTNKIKNHPNIHLISNQKRYDHSKLIIIDEKIGFIGGVGFANEFLNEWEDVSIKINDKNVISKLILKLSHNDKNDNYKIKFYTNKFHENKNNIFNKLIDFIITTKDNINISIAYLGNPTYIKKLKEIALKNKKINIILSDRSNIHLERNIHFIWELIRKIIYSKSKIKYLINFNTKNKMIPNNISIYKYHKMLHSKCILKDNHIFYIGSANLSMDNGFNEIGTIINLNKKTDKKLLKKIEKYFEDLKNEKLKIKSIKLNLNNTSIKNESISFSLIRSRFEYLGVKIQTLMLNPLFRKKQVISIQKEEEKIISKFYNIKNY